MKEETFKKEDGKLVEAKTVEQSYTYEDITSEINKLNAALEREVIERDERITAMENTLAMWQKRLSEATRLGVEAKVEEVIEESLVEE